MPPSPQELPSINRGQSQEERLKSLHALIKHYGDIHGASQGQRTFVAQILLCENRDIDPELQSMIVTHGEREDSWGLAQIHLPSHPTISKEMAQNPYFAVDFTVKNVVGGRAHMWTCARTIQKQIAEDTSTVVPPS